MVRCDKCGIENTADSAFCKSCGVPLAATGESAQPESPPSQESSKSFEKEMNEMGERIGKGMEEAAKSFGEKAEKMGKNMNAYYSARLGLLGPFVWSLVMLLFAVVFIELVGLFTGGRALRRDLNEFLVDYFLLIFALALLGSYGDYLNKRHRREYRWVWPVVTAAGAVGGFWLFAKFIAIFGNHWGWSFLLDVADLINLLLPLILILVLVIGYVVAFMSVAVKEALKS